MKLDKSTVRSFFPALASDWVYMDNAGGSQVVEPVVDRIRSYLLESNVQHGASYEPSRVATARVAEGTQAIADFMGCAPDEVVLGSSTSMLLKNLSRSMEPDLSSGDEIIVSRCDHEANVGPWFDMERQGVRIVFWDPDPETLALRVEDLERLLTPRTKLVAFTHCSNLVGTIHDVQSIAARVREHGALTCVDGVAYAAHRRLEVQDWDVDFYVFSLYKTYGPHCAALYGRKRLLESMRGINHYFLEEKIPYKFQPGNVNYEMTYSLAGLWDYVDALTGSSDSGTRRTRLAAFFGGVAQHEEELAESLLAFLRENPKVTIYGESRSSGEVRVPTISCRVAGMDSRTFVERMDEFRIGIRWGDFYARRLADALKLDETGVIRMSLVHYNTQEEVERLISAMSKILGRA